MTHRAENQKQRCWDDLDIYGMGNGGGARKVLGSALTQGLSAFSGCLAGSSSFRLQFQNTKIRLMETFSCRFAWVCVWVNGVCVCELSVCIPSTSMHANMFRRRFCLTGILNLVLAKVPLCGRPQNVVSLHRQTYVFMWDQHKGTMWVSFSILSLTSSWLVFSAINPLQTKLVLLL